MAAHDWPAVRERCFQMALETKRSLEQTFGTTAICPETFDWFSQLVAIRLPDDTDVVKLGALLREQYHMEAPTLNWNGVKIARLSVQVYTSQDELDALFEALTTHVLACKESAPGAAG